MVSTNAFKSTVYHLYHGHQTEKRQETRKIFNRHKDLDKEGWLEEIRSDYDWGTPIPGTINMNEFKPYINETLLYVYKTSSKPRITICMVNFLRYSTLIKSIKTLLDFNIPLNFILWVNESDSMPNDIREKVENLCKGFSSHEIIYNKKNSGTGYPRFMMFNKAKYEYDTDYIMTMDDDIIHQNVESLILGATILDQKEYNDFGSIGLWCHPRYQIVKKGRGVLEMTDPKEGFYEVDCLGAATMVFRKKVLDTCNCDPQYVIGFVDWDFSLSMRDKGWKLGLICDDRYKPINDITESNDKKYKSKRCDDSIINDSKNLFKKKWGINV